MEAPLRGTTHRRLADSSAALTPSPLLLLSTIRKPAWQEARDTRQKATQKAQLTYIL
jgi:hypothetical protein